MDRRTLGTNGEDAAAAFLTQRGYRIVSRNVRTRMGEIDLIASVGDTLAFIEVKTRSSRRFGSPAEAVTPRKAARIRRLAAAHLAASGLSARNIRFDVIEVERAGEDLWLRHLEGAF